MERREQYDPEDIEALLLERPFGDLLPEERAFVLRHLSGQEEYEAMRATLNAMRHLDNERLPIEADVAVRDTVMAAFRAQQQPQWRIWLNSIGPVFMPKEGQGMWIPTLRIAGVAAVIGAGIWGVNRFTDLPSHDMVAEVKQEREPLPAKPTAPAASTGTEMISADSGTLGDTETAASVNAQRNGLASDGVAQDVKTVEFKDAQPVPLASGTSADMDKVAAAPVEEELNAEYFDVRTMTDTVFAANGVGEASPAREKAAEHIVTVAEVAATRADRAEARKAETTKKNKALLAQEKDDNGAMANSQALDQRLLSLQNAAW